MNIFPVILRAQKWADHILEMPNIEIKIIFRILLLNFGLPINAINYLKH